MQNADVYAVFHNNVLEFVGEIYTGEGTPPKELFIQASEENSRPTLRYVLVQE